MRKGLRYGNICVGLVFCVIVGRDQGDTISCSWIFQNKFEIVYMFRGLCYCTVIPACVTMGLACCGLSFQTHRERPSHTLTYYIYNVINYHRCECGHCVTIPTT